MTPTKFELITFFKRRWGWKGSPRMFDNAAEIYLKDIKEGTLAWDGENLTRVEQ